MRLLVIILFFPCILFARQKISIIHPNVEVPYEPWFTGPLLVPTPVNMPITHPAIEPSITIFNIYGRYNDDWNLKKQASIWAINPLIDFQFGITEAFGIQALGSFIANFKNGHSAVNFQDTVVYFGYQISKDKKGSWVPDFRVILQETFPTGKYQKLNPKKEGIDATGQGSFQTGPALTFRKLFYLPNNFFILYWCAGYLFPTKVGVKGFNTYGGGFGTRGKARPGQTFFAFLSGEYSFNQRWGFTFDTEFLLQRSSHFSGKKGINSMGDIANVTLPTFMQLSFAPAIEYNFKQGSGLLIGSWFTILGKNSPAFASIFAAYLYIF